MLQTTEQKLRAALRELELDLDSTPWRVFHGNPGAVWRTAHPHYAVRLSIDGDIKLVMDTAVRDQDMLARRAARLMLTRRNTKVKFSRDSVLLTTTHNAGQYALLFDKLDDAPPHGEITTNMMEWNAWLCAANGPRSAAFSVDWVKED